MNLKAVRLSILILATYLKRNLKLVAVLAVIFAIVAVAQVKFNLFHRGNSIRIGLVGTYQEHDLPDEVTQFLSEGLVKVGSDGRIKPNLVSGWEVNNDATQFKFKLKADLKWIDGSFIKAADLQFNIPNTEISYPGDHEVQFNLKQPYSPLPSLLTKPIFKKGKLLGTGPYHIQNIEKSRIFITKLTLQPKDGSKLPKVFIRFYPNEKVALTGFQLGEVEALLGLSNPSYLTQNPKIVLRQSTDYSRIVTILFNTADPILKNRSIRQALAYQTPKIAGEEVADNPYPPTLWAYDSKAKKYLSKTNEAQEALQRAKSSLADEQLQEELILTATPNLEEVGRLVISAWKDQGFEARLRIESGIPQNFQILLITQSIPQDPDQYFLWHSTQTKTNLSKYDSKRVDKDLEDGRKEVSEEKRKEKYLDFQKTLLEDAPTVFLYYPKYNIVYLKKSEPLLGKILSLK